MGWRSEGKESEILSNRRGDVGRVQRRKNQVSGFGRSHRDAHGLGIAHFAHDNHVGSLPQGGTQRGREVGRVHSDFHLLHDALEMLMLVLERVFDGDDVARFAAIDFVNQRSHGRGLSRARRSADQNQAAR